MRCLSGAAQSIHVSSPIEHERRFIVDQPTWRAYATDPTPITQGWLVHEDGVQVRVRLGEDWGSMACKASIGAEEEGRRIELESMIDVEHARELLGRCPLRLEKIRWHVSHGPYTYDVDEYLGALAGIVTAEVEDPGSDFTPAPWLGREVTGEEAWSNAGLARARSAE